MSFSAALRGLNLRLGGMGLGFCASCSVAISGCSVGFDWVGGRVSCTNGMGFAMDVSGIGSLRGEDGSLEGRGYD